jgi:hypothetical protein
MQTYAISVTWCVFLFGIFERRRAPGVFGTGNEYKNSELFIYESIMNVSRIVKEKRHLLTLLQLILVDLCSLCGEGGQEVATVLCHSRQMSFEIYNLRYNRKNLVLWFFSTNTTQN